MRLYLSSFTTDHLLNYLKLFPETKMNILVSYGLRNKSIPGFLFDYADNINSLILDSGTFTMNFAKQRSTCDRIDFTGYRAFLKIFGDRFDYVFNFDSDFSTEGQQNNDRYLKTLQDDGHNVVPVVHSYTGEEVESYLDAGHKLIALGFSRTRKTTYNITRLCKLIHDNGAKAHVLGVSAWNKLSRIPIAYCDSSSWVQHGMYGCIQYWNKNKATKPGGDKTDSIRFLDSANRRKSDHYYHDYESKEELYAWIKDTFGWDEHVLPSIDGRSKRTLVNIHYFVELQRRLTKFHNNH